MQKFWQHGIPIDSGSKHESFQSGKAKDYEVKEDLKKCRMVVVLRRGDERLFSVDTGVSEGNLQPKLNNRPYIFGAIKGIDEGLFYTMKELKQKCGPT
jgi:hypothetical protein